MKKRFIFLLAFMTSTLLFSQIEKKVKPVVQTHSAVIQKLVNAKKYDLIGDFFVVQEKPTIKYAKVFKQYKGWGYIDIDGKEIIETKYIFLTDFYQGICKVTYTARRKHPSTGILYDATLVGLMNIERELVTKNDYTNITFFKDYQSQNINHDPYQYIQTNFGNKVGLISKEGWEILPAKYDEIRKLKNSIIVKSDGKWAFAKLNGAQLTDFIYDRIDFHKNFIFGEQNDGRFLINEKTGKHLSEEKFDINYNLSDHDNYESGGKDIDFLIMRKGERNVLLSKNGKSIIEANGLGKSSNEYYSIRYKNKIGLINSTGKLVLDTIYTRTGTMGRDEKEPNFFGELPDKKFEYFDKNFKKINVPADFRQLNNNRIVFIENEKMGIMTPKGKIIFPAILNSINHFEYYDYTVGVLENYTKKGLISRNGKVVLPFIYDEIYYFGNQYNEIKKDNKWGLINYEGKIKVPIIYDAVSRINDQEGNWEKLFVARLNQQSKLIDFIHNIIIPNLQGGFSEVKQNFRNQKVTYSYTNNSQNGGNQDKGPFGLKAKDGAVIFAPQFDAISDFQNGFACAEPLGFNSYHDRRYLIDTNGNKVYLQYIDDQQKTIEQYQCFDNRQFNWNNF